jgi:hypothetical protein
MLLTRRSARQRLLESYICAGPCEPPILSAPHDIPHGLCAIAQPSSRTQPETIKVESTMRVTNQSLIAAAYPPGERMNRTRASSSIISPARCGDGPFDSFRAMRVRGIFRENSSMIARARVRARAQERVNPGDSSKKRATRHGMAAP